MIGADNQQERLEPQWVLDIPEYIGWYLTGFADGEGSFIASLRKENGHRLGWQVQLAFNVAQRDVSNLVLFKHYIGCGRLQYRRDGVYYFITNDFRSIIDRIIPFFDHFPFFSDSRRKNFSLFKEIAILVDQRQHLEPEGPRKIILIREKLNEGRGRTRKYNASDIIINGKRILRDYTPNSDSIGDDIVRTL